ncbi:MAG: Ig domain-containing protein [Lachnospiraceae bacterium]|nr:Ig domain-containing protein [Lachnospiraceae bacterium]
MLKFKRVLAMMLAFIMTVSMISVAPSTEVNAAPSKYVKSLSLNKSKLTIESGKTAKIKATVKVKGKASTKVKVSLSKANKKVVKKAKVGSPKKGVSTITFTAAKVTSKKTTTIKVVTSAKNKKNKKITKTIKVTVAPKKATTPEQPTEVAPTSVTVTTAKSTISVGEATVVTATVLPANASNKTVTYTSSNPAVAVVSNTGAVTGISAGEATITATTVNGKVAAVKITVVKVEATGISLDKNSVDLSVSGTTTVVATVLPENATDKTVTWSSSNETVASVKDGVVTGLSAGTADITAKTSNGLTKTCKVTVTKKSVLADGVSIEVANPYEDAMGNEYANTALVGDDMTVRTRVVKNGQPIGNTSVTLSMVALYGNCADAFEVRESTVVTDTNGYANFAIGLKSGKDYNFDAVSGKYQSFVVKAQESGSNASEELTIKFASIDINGITVENNRRIDIPDITPSDNASASDDGIASTYYLEEDQVEEYVSSQQVSTDKADHKVYLTAAPYIVMPATKDTAHMGDWEYIVANGTSGPCSVYNDDSNETTTVQVTQIPAGLRYITLHFDKISLSKYIKMNIALYNAATGALISEKDVTVKEQDSKGIQVPTQDDTSCFLVVSLVSQGQVDTTHEGYVLKKLVGVWKSENSEVTTVEELPGTVTWENVSGDVLYELKSSSYAELKDYLPTDSEFVDEKYQYSYRVPVFPYTGNADIIVKDTNGKSVLAYFMYPTVNNGENVNVLAPLGSDKAVFASKEEVNNMVGTIITDDNMVIVDSRESGRVGLKATVTVPGLSDKELNSQNGGLLYSSVQFSPIPKQDEVKEYPDFFAIEGQYVEVTAQLYDVNGNEKSDPGKQISFKVKGETVDLASVLASEEKKFGSLATLVEVTNSGSTDATGTVTLKIKDLTDNETYSLVEELSAEAKGYNVKLSIAGAGEVEVADIYWVDLGMTFVDSAVKEDVPVRTTQFENSTKAIDKEATYTVDDKNGWQIGYLPVARSMKFRNPYFDLDNFTKPEHELNYVDEFVSVSGVSVDYSKDSTDVALEESNNVAILKTTVAGKATLTGTLVITDPSKVQFTFYNENGEKVTHKNIGKGNPLVEQTGLKLTTVWETVDVNVNLVAPKNIYTNTASTVYVVVTDKYSNAIKNAKVAYSVAGVHTMQAEGVTNDKGVLAIPLEAVSVDTAASDVVSVTVNETEKATCTISYTPYADSISGFALRAETETAFAITVGEDKKTINVFFSNAVSADSIKAGQFKFEQNGSEDNTYKVVSAVLGSENTCVTLTLDKAIVSEGANHTLTIENYTDVTTGIVYTLRDTYGQVFAGVTYEFKPNERTK